MSAGRALGGDRLLVLVLGAGTGAGAGAVSWPCNVWKTGCWFRHWRCAPGAGAGAVSWLRRWWRQVAGVGAGCRAPVLVLVL